MTDPDSRAREAVDRYWDDVLRHDPLLGTQIGDERSDDRLPDPSEEGLAARQQLHTAALQTLASLDRDSLDVSVRTSLDVMEAIAQRELAAIEHRLDRLAVVSHLWGPGQLLAELGSLQRADTPDRLDRYASRLAALPDYLDAVRIIAEEGVRLGQTVPLVVIDRTIAQVERLLALEVEESPALRPLPADGAGRERIIQILREKVLPAYRRYLDTLRAYRPSATETIGLCALPGGEAMYAAQILAWTTLPLEAREIHEVGVEDLVRIQEERQVVAERLGFRDAAAAEAAAHESEEHTASSREELVRLAEEQVQRGWDAAPRFFGWLPEHNCEVRAVEEFREKDMPFAFYQSPSEDGSRPGIYYVNTSDLPERPLHHLATTTYHEANPGHHFQLAIEQELPDRPALRRFGGILGGSAFVEGWGLYSERLADEMELFQEEYERLGMLSAQGMRAARLVVDTGIHDLGWDRDRAIAKMQEAGVPRVDAIVEVDRYITMPGQALSYKIGQTEIERWRSAAEKREGASFSLSEFHDRLLALGSLPLTSLRRELGFD